MHSVTDRFVETWTSIKSLKSLDPEALHRYWQQVDEFIGTFDEMVHLGQPVDDIFQEIIPVFSQLLRLGDFIRARHIMRQLFDRSNCRENRMTRLRTAFRLGYVQFVLGNFTDAEQSYIEGMLMLDDSPAHQIQKAIQLSNLGMVTGYHKELDRATSYTLDAIRLLNYLESRIGIKEFNRIVSQFEAPDYHSQQSAVHSNLGAIYLAMANDSTSEPTRERYLKLSVRHQMRSIQKARNPADLMRSQANLSLSLVCQGFPKRAEKILSRIAAKCEATESDRYLSWISGFRAEAKLRLDQPVEALQLCHKSLKHAIRAADPVSEGQSIIIAMEPLKQICSRTFSGDISTDTFQASGFPIIRQILDFLEDKDWYTGRDHSIGVGRIATSIFDIIRVTPDSLELEHDRSVVLMAALLHDIGKLWIPWTILNRTTPLWPEEFEIIHSHPDRGREFLKELGFPVIGDMLGRHHERPDGKGYPHGGDIGGTTERILAIADCFEAMTTPNRLYREPLSEEEAVRRIMELGGQQFDAEIARRLPAALT
ncbi:HD domain-containing protein [bacterium]|nr:HD domain-containing protein [candidate division CSSED10-310 bacterium]